METNHRPHRVADTNVWNEPESYIDRPRFVRPIPPAMLRRVMQDDWAETYRRQLRLEVHPPIGRYQLVFMGLVAVFLGFACAVTF
jgi:hypothetical protein